MSHRLDLFVIAHTISLYSMTGGRWALSPVIIYSEDSMLNPQNIIMEGINKTVQLIYVGSKTDRAESIMVI